MAALIDVEKEITALAKTPEELDNLRKAASIGLKSAVQDVERQLFNAKESAKSKSEFSSVPPSYIAALESSLVSLKSMLHSVEKGNDTHPSSRVQ